MISFWWLILAVIVGSIFGYFLACLMMMSKTSDLEMENIQLKEKNKPREVKYEVWEEDL